MRQDGFQTVIRSITTLVMYQFDDIILNRVQSLKHKIGLTDQTGTIARPTPTIFLKRDKVIQKIFPHNRNVAKGTYTICAKMINLFCL